MRRHWLPEVKNNADLDCEKVLLLNKMDLGQKDLDAIEVQDFTGREGITVYETSAKTGKNVTGVFTELCRKLMAKAHDVNRKRARNTAPAERSLFKSSQYDQQDNIQLNQGNAGEQKQQGVLSNCCGN